MMSRAQAAAERRFALVACVTLPVVPDCRPADLEAFVAARVGEATAALRRALGDARHLTLHAPDPRDVPVCPVAWDGDTIGSGAEIGEALQRFVTLQGVPRWGADSRGLIGWSLSVSVERAPELDRPVAEVWSMEGDGAGGSLVAP